MERFIEFIGSIDFKSLKIETLQVLGTFINKRFSRLSLKLIKRKKCPVILRKFLLKRTWFENQLLLFQILNTNAPML